MDVLLYFTIVTIIAILETDNQVKANFCNTAPPETAKCNQHFQVSNGKACYFEEKRTRATISCSDMYTLHGSTTFQCVQGQKTWSPTSSVKCSSIIPESTHTASTPTKTPTFTSTVFQSENSLLPTVESSGTSSLTTYSMLSKTKISDISSKFQAKPSSIKPSPAMSTESSMISFITASSSISVIPDPEASHEVKSPDINAVYITVPVVVCVIALLLGVGIIWWRRRTSKPAALFERREPGSLITNQVYEANGIDRHCSLMNVRQSRVNEYAEIPLDIKNSDETIGDNYQTIDILPEDKADMKKSYDTFKLSETEFIDTNYSHIGLNSTRNNTHADNTYSHTQLEDVTQKPEITINGDDTYNKLNTTTLPQKRCQDTESSDTEYSHAHAGRHDPENEADNYSHLNTNMQTPGTSTEKPKHQFEDGMKNKNSNIRQLSAKDPPSNTGYEFAKDFDNLQSRSEAPEYAKGTKKKPAFNEAHNAGKGYETAVSTTHNYLILEPDTNPAPTSTLFKVVEDLSAETDEMPEAETGHEYFTLEKQDI